MPKKVVTLGEIMLRLSTPDFKRFVQSDSFDVTYGGGEANVSAAICNYGENGVFGIGRCLAFGRLAHQAFAVLGKGNHRRGGAGAFRIFENHGFAAFHHGHAGVGGAEVDA